MTVRSENVQLPSRWRYEARHQLRAGGTLAFNQLLQITIPFVTVVMAGRLGVSELAAASLVSSIGLLLFITALGVLQGLIPLLSSGIGAGNDDVVAGAARGGLLVAAGMGIIATAVMASAPWWLVWMGQDPALVALAQRFIVTLLPGYLPSILALALRFFLVAVDELTWLNPIIIAMTAFNVACNLMLLAGGLDGLSAIGASLALTNWLTFGFLLVVVLRSPRLAPGFLSHSARASVRQVLSFGLPVGAILFTETMLFSGSSVLMGYFGNAAMAAHGVVLLWLNIALMIPVGVSQAAMARVAFLLARGDIDAARNAGFVAILIAGMFSIGFGLLLVAFPEALIRLVLLSRPAGSETVIEAGRDFLRIYAATQLLSGLVIVGASVLRGMRDANSALWLVMLGYWGVGLGGATVFAFVLPLGGNGIWLGMTLGFLFALLIVQFRLVRAYRRARLIVADIPAANAMPTTA
jgi:multidrug resistance protein, MATE family